MPLSRVVVDAARTRSTMATMVGDRDQLPADGRTAVTTTTTSSQEGDERRHTYLMGMGTGGGGGWRRWRVRSRTRSMYVTVMHVDDAKEEEEEEEKAKDADGDCHDQDLVECCVPEVGKRGCSVEGRVTKCRWSNCLPRKRRAV